MDQPTPEPESHNPIASTASPWVTYLTGKKVSPESVFKQADGLSESEKREFGDALVDRPDRVERLLLMLQAPGSTRDPICKIVDELTATGLVRLGIVASQDQLNKTTFRESVSSWLEGKREEPMKRDTVDQLLLSLLYGARQRSLDQDAVHGFLFAAGASATAAAPKKRHEPSLPSLLKVMLAARKSEPVFQAMRAYLHDARLEQRRVDSELRRRSEQTSSLHEKNALLNTEIADLSVQISALQEQLHAVELTNASLQKHGEETRASYQHRLDDVRGHIRGTLEGQLTRWLETSLDASRANPPRAEIIEERLEEALKLIEKELRWLQPSA